jgi:hypothetical protein
MGAIAEAIMAYAQPLIDETDGSVDQLNSAMAVSQLCFNAALLPEDRLESFLREMQPTLKLDDDEFDAFRRSVVDPMIRRHHEMFPLMHQRRAAASWQSGCEPLPRETHGKKFTGTIDRYAPCPCNSGRKYKFCCGRKGS